jgi:hypothetical protein
VSFSLCTNAYPLIADQKIPAMDKLHYYVCQTDQLLAKYVKIAEVDSGHILEVDWIGGSLRRIDPHPSLIAMWKVSLALPPGFSMLSRILVEKEASQIRLHTKDSLCFCSLRLDKSRAHNFLFLRDSSVLLAFIASHP